MFPGTCKILATTSDVKIKVSLSLWRLYLLKDAYNYFIFIGWYGGKSISEPCLNSN